jgi:predicted nucleic acid-binding protein
MRSVDTSVVVAAFASWHEYHERARSVLDSGVGLIEHCALETYSVLTRLPPPHRCSGSVVRDFMRARFQRPFLRMDVPAYREFILGLPNHEIAGGSAYDALVAATAVHSGTELVTCDRRAASVYERYGVRTTFLI